MSNLTYKQYISNLDTLFDTLCKLHFGYPAIKIGGQIWMLKNLDVDTFKNGDLIPQITSDDIWEEYGRLGKPAWCYYENNKSNGEIYGKLYNWHAVNDQRGLAPSGWHVPTKTEWDSLVNFLGGGDKAFVKMQSTLHSHIEKSTNESGFTALCGGVRSDCFDGIGAWGGGWWSSTDGMELVEQGFFWKTRRPSDRAHTLYLCNYQFGTWTLSGDKGFGYSVRCLKD